MPIPIILPKFGFTVETSTIVQWLKKDGDSVRNGDPICEVTTDKVNMEVEAPEAGTLFGLQFEAGTEVPVTQVIAYLLRPGEARPESTTTPLPQTHKGTAGETNPLIAAKVSATPLARRIAQAANLSLHTVQGSGPRGRIQSTDVHTAIQRADALRQQAEQAAKSLLNAVQGIPEPAPHPNGSDAPKLIKMAGMRRTIAIRLQQSFQTAPHIFFDAQIETSGLDALRHKVKARHEKLSVTAILVKACAWALLQHPYLNATLEGEEISLWPTANIGVAVALDEGLVVPVVHHAERLSIRDIQKSVDGVVERARSNTLHISDMQGGTFTISNLGMYGVDRFTAIINPPQVAILAVGRTIQQFVPNGEGKPILRSILNVTLSADHRVVDGAHAAHFLADLRTVLEEPSLLAW